MLIHDVFEWLPIQTILLGETPVLAIALCVCVML
jgi:hypothetical protein